MFFEPHDNKVEVILLDFLENRFLFISEGGEVADSTRIFDAQRMGHNVKDIRQKEGSQTL